MKLSGNIFIAVTLIAACSTVICGTANGMDFDTLEGYVLCDATNGRSIWVTALFIAGALGVILTGWHILRMAGAITSIARLLDNEAKDSD